MPVSAPDQIVTPWAESGLKADIPESADPVNGRAGFDQGFPVINMTPKTAGGIPPFGQDFNGILYDVTLALQYLEAGGTFPYDGTWATAVGGYPVGALVSRSDNAGLWRNTVANNTTDPEAGGAGWQPEGSGATSVTMTSSNVTLTALQASRQMIIITGTLSADLQLIIPAFIKQWLIVNSTSGAYQITAKTAAGSGVVIEQGMPKLVYCDGASIDSSVKSNAITDYLNTLRIAVAVSSTVNLDSLAPNTSNILLTGPGTINNFTVSAGRVFFATVSGSVTLSSSASINTNGFGNISAKDGDTLIIRSITANNVEILCYTSAAQTGIGGGQTWQNVSASRAADTIYSNNTGRSIMVNVGLNNVAGRDLQVSTDGVTWVSVARSSGGGVYTGSAIVPPGHAYRVQTSYESGEWMELRS